ncbi:MAG: ParB/RepB/Spo0J family partition protein [Bacteroidota bacterium]
MAHTANIGRKNALGRGLKALLGDSHYLPEGQPHSLLTHIPIEQIQANPAQPRTHFNPIVLQELSESIKVHGIIQPLTVRKLQPNTYQLITGERRLQAAQRAGLREVPVYVRTANDQQMLEMALVENIQRENLNPLEIALSYQRLLTECSIKQEALGSRVGKDRTTVSNYLRLLKLPPDIQCALRDQTISMGHARALVSLPDTDTQRNILQMIVQRGLSVREVERWAKNWLDKPEVPSALPKAKETACIAGTEGLTERLSNRLAATVKIKTYAKEKGEISIAFTNAQDLHRITTLLSG